MTALAIGYQGQPHHLPARYAERDQRVRERKPVADILLAGSL